MNDDNAFKFLRKQKINALNIEISEYEHDKLGCKHYHLHTESDENVFLIAFKTVPMDSTGVAHILEHTSLCGSKKYPVRDPFFMMTRRSLNTFMNAFTAADWTAYPFATRNLKDFSNLRKVYLDAVFQSRLDPLDFAQEGHRIELTTNENNEETAVFKGIVYNEMKGAMSSPISILYQNLSKYLYPTQTYHYNSGGEPDHIPDLSYQGLIDFYEAHYHPSNATFFTYGNIPAIEHQVNFHKEALERFTLNDVSNHKQNIRVGNEKRYLSPIRIQEAYAAQPTPKEQDSRDSYVIMAWLLPAHDHFQRILEYYFLSEILLGTSAAPLMKALETTNLGDAPSPLIGLHDNFKEAAFCCGLQGTNSEDFLKIEEMILETLKRISTEEIPQEDIDATLHQLELSQREIRGDAYPFGLELIMEALTPALHGHDPFEFLEIDEALNNLKKKAASKDFIPALIKECLLENQHRITLTLYPDLELNARKAHNEEKHLKQIYNRLSEAEKKDIQEKTQQLENRQAQIDDPEILPKVTLQDIPASICIPEGVTLPSAEKRPAKLTAYKSGTNGIFIQKVIASLPQLSQEELPSLNLLWTIWTQVGTRNESYLKLQKKINQYTGGINAGSSLSADKQDLNRFTAFVSLSSKGLRRNQAAVSDLLSEFWQAPNFNEIQRIKDLLQKFRQDIINTVTEQGHSLAIQASTSHLYPVKHFTNLTEGLPFIQWLKSMGGDLKKDECIEKICDRLKNIQTRIAQSPCQHLYITDEEPTNLDIKNLTKNWQFATSEPQEQSFYEYTFKPNHQNTVWFTSSQVNFCAKSYPTVAQSHQDIPKLRVLAAVLKNSFLHTQIREKGGAYGGGAMLNVANGGFSFFSYRDPRLKETLADFDRSINWILDESIEDRHLEEAILSIIGSIDKPLSPAGEASHAFFENLFNRSKEERLAWRKQITEVSKEDLIYVANKYLQPEKGICAVITDKHTWAKESLKDFSEFEI